ncbi:MAG: glycosyltransferase family protein [candidate division Zixibacteria bacterium]|nr:glycosyltransferase family protein [candidate division Zixibacteria bacterium]
MKAALIIQARMNSTRLPGKVLKEVLGRPLLFYQLERLRRVCLQDEIIIATTVNKADETIVAFCEKQGVPCHRGSEEDVLARYLETADVFGVSDIVRITADCPLIDPAIIDRVIKVYFDGRGEIDYAANTLERTFPRGMDCEVFSFEVLKEINDRAAEISDREHVTSYIYKHPEKYRLKNIAGDKDHSAHRWTVDTPEDFELIRRMIKELYPVKPAFHMADCLEVLARHPDWIKINQHVKQKAF